MQLRKNPPFEINSNDPFQDDRLDHRTSIELLTRLVQSAEQPFVVTVEAPWGWGKTKFIERWKAHLAKQNHLCLYFNAWENDFVSDPLVAFIGELGPIVEAAKGGTDENSTVRKQFSRLRKVGISLAKKSAPIIVKVAVMKALGADAVKEAAEIVADSAEDVADALSESVKKQIENYDHEKEGIQKFHKILGDLAEKVTAGEDRPKQLVFFVDELDRCRPDFAITLLERIKHLFNVDRIVFILALDREQLRNTVRHIYGSGENADVYLRRFIDFSFRLPKPSGEAFFRLLAERFQIEEFFNERPNGNLEYERFCSSFVKTANWLDLDLRTQEQCLTRLNANFRLWLRGPYIPTNALCVLVGLRVGKPEIFELLRLDKTPISALIPKPTKEDVDREFSLLVETTLMVTFKPTQEIFDELRRIQEDYRAQKDQLEAHYLARKMDFLEHLRQNKAELIRLFEFSGRFA